MATFQEESFILGLDLGSNSLGWALIEQKDGAPSGLVRAGVRIFESGTEGDRESGQEESRNRARREARMHRRQLWRRARRLSKVFRLLQGFGLLPPGNCATPDKRQDLLNELDRTILRSPWFEAKRQSGVFPEPHHALPYILRATALDEPLEPYFLGRALYHLAQRRGFLSSRLQPAKKDEDQGEVKKGIGELREKMKAAGARTLGEHFARLSSSEQRIRGRWTHRDMYRSEFNSIWDAQSRFHPELLTEQRKKELYRAMFFQRPLKFDPDVIGRCELEPDYQRAPAFTLISQRFRLLQTLNNLRILPPSEMERALTPEERQKLLDALELQNDLTFPQIRKLLDLSKNYAFNLERGGEKRIKGNRTNADFYAAFGERWLKMTCEERDRAVEYVYAFEKPDKLKHAAKKRWQLHDEAAEKLSEVSFEPDYMSISRRAMEKVMPMLEQGVTFAEARRQLYPERFQAAEPEPLLPPVNKALVAIRNPAVTRSLTELRKVVNGIIRQHGKPSEIHIELARDLRKPKWQRQEASDRMRANEKARKSAADRILKEAGIQNPKAEDIRKVQLADECGWKCPYTDKSIAMRKLVGPESEFQIEHIIPFSRSLDNTFVNLTLCHVEENAVKSNRTPHEAYSGNSDRYEAILGRVKKFTGSRGMVAEKLKRFQMTPEEVEAMLGDFSERQLRDTAYASKLASQYISVLYGGLSDAEHQRRVQATSGRATAFLRNEWGLNAILKDGSTDRGGTVPKGRTDHRHHAVDAVAIALTSPATVKQLSDAAQRAPIERRRRFGSLQAPWPDFVDSVRDVIDSIVVSHRVSKKVSGALHEETNYSPPEKPGRPTLPPRTRRVIDPRLPGKRLSKAEVKHISDERVRQIVMQKLNEVGVDDPQKAFGDPRNLPCLPNRNGAPVPIKKVRIDISDPVNAVGKNEKIRYVTTDSNHHVELIATLDHQAEEIDWDGRVVPMKDAYDRIRAKAPVINRGCKPGDQYKLSLCPGEILKCDDENRGRRLLVYKGVSQYTAGPVVISLLPINDARKNPKLTRVVPNTLRKWHARKVLVSPLGEVSEAHD